MLVYTNTDIRRYNDTITALTRIVYLIVYLFYLYNVMYTVMF